ncbi:MAG TPA: hypothetical protein VF555_20435 [Variovorax sp.]
MLRNITPFRQLLRLYASILSTASSIENIRVELAQRPQAQAFPENSERQLADISARVATMGKVSDLGGARTVGHTWQDTEQMLRELRREIDSQMPGNVAALGWNSFAQCDEDGMIRACLNRVAQLEPLSKTFIEIGCGNGLENNTHQLLLDGYRGCWLDGNPANIASIAEQLGTLEHPRLLVTEAFVTLDSIAPLTAEFRKHLGTGSVDFFSFDIDGNDLHLMPLALNEITPKIICVEYNGKFPPPTNLAMAYVGDHQWAHDDYYGASLQAWVDLFEGRYTLISCNLSGVNAFFVRNDLLSAFEVYPVEKLYQPCRYWLVGNSGHRSSLKWLSQVIASPIKNPLP